MNEPISGTLVRLTTEGGRGILGLHAQARALALRALARGRLWVRAGLERRGAGGETNEPISGAIVKLTTEGGRAILALPGRGRALVKRVPQPVQTELKKLSAHGAPVRREIFAGILVLGLGATVLGS